MDFTSLLNIAGQEVLSDIIENIQAGHDYNGKSYQYSTKAFWMPYNPRLYKLLGGKEEAEAGKLFRITANPWTGRLGILMLEGEGYNAFKKKVYPGAYNHFLTITGSMLRGMRVIRKQQESLTIGWTDARNIAKAFYLNVAGAGKGKMLWKFLGITEKQKQELCKHLQVEASKIVSSAIDDAFKNK
jgi:hypothetical protein